MISERSCDTEDWSNDAGNSALSHKNTSHFKIENNYFKSKNISQYYCLNCISDQINAAFEYDRFSKCF